MKNTKIEKEKLNNVITENDLRRLKETNITLKQIRRNFEWLKNNGVHFVQPIHKTMEEIELEANRRYGVENCSKEKNDFINACMWASNKI